MTASLLGVSEYQRQLERDCVLGEALSKRGAAIAFDIFMCACICAYMQSKPTGREGSGHPLS